MPSSSTDSAESEYLLISSRETVSALTVTGDLKLAGNLRVTGDFKLGGSIKEARDVRVKGNADIRGDANVLGGLTVGKNLSVGLTLAVHGTLTTTLPNVSQSIIYETSTGNDRLWNVNPDNDTVTVIDTVMSAFVAELRPHQLAGFHR